MFSTDGTDDIVTDGKLDFDMLGANDIEGAKDSSALGD